jgi:hypothetical protein
VDDEDKGQYVGTMLATFEEFIQKGSYDESARAPRLTVVHNPYATHRLNIEVFGGPHDIQWAEYVNGDSVALTEVACGIKCFELPDR